MFDIAPKEKDEAEKLMAGVKSRLISEGFTHDDVELAIQVASSAVIIMTAMRNLPVSNEAYLNMVISSAVRAIRRFREKQAENNTGSGQKLSDLMKSPFDPSL